MWRDVIPSFLSVLYVNLLMRCFDLSIVASCLCFSLTFFFCLSNPPPHLFLSCWVLSCIWFLLSSPVSLECFCWSLTFPAVPQGVCLCVHVKPGVCSLGCVCQWCRGYSGGGGRRRCECVSVCVRWLSRSCRGTVTRSVWEKFPTFPGICLG